MKKLIRIITIIGTGGISSISKLIKLLVITASILTVVSCGGVEQTKEPWEFEVDFCESQGGYALTDYDYQSDEVIVSCKKKVCYALCKPYATYCPEVPCG